MSTRLDYLQAHRDEVTLDLISQWRGLKRYQDKGVLTMISCSLVELAYSVDRLECLMNNIEETKNTEKQEYDAGILTLSGALGTLDANMELRDGKVVVDQDAMHDLLTAVRAVLASACKE